MADNARAALVRFFVAACMAVIMTGLAPPAFALAEDKAGNRAGDEVDLHALFSRWLEEDGIAGGVLLIASPAERLTVATGVADRRTQTPVTAQTRFYAASTGKMMVAAAILAATDDGLVSLEDPIDGFLGTLDGAHHLADAGTVTLEHLLNHSSGLPDYLTHHFSDASFAAPETRWTAAEALLFASDAPAMPPGTRFDYSNTNYVLLGHVLSTLDGSLAQSLERRVFGGAGMRETSVGASPGLGGLLARGYDEDGEDVSELGWNSVLGDGPVVTTIGDLEAFARALFGGQRIISRVSREAMLAPSALEPAYGLGVSIEADTFGLWYGHSGAYDGFEADLRYYPANDLVMAYMINGNQTSDIVILDEAAAWFFSD